MATILMTREDAVRRVIDARYGPAAFENVEAQANAHAAVREYVSLGLIRLEEPRGYNQGARERFRREGLNMDAGEIYLGAIERAGLKIVEK